MSIFREHLSFLQKPEANNIFLDLIEVIIDQTCIWKMDVKVVGGYSGIPVKKGIPQLVFCSLNPNGRVESGSRLGMISLMKDTRITLNNEVVGPGVKIVNESGTDESNCKGNDDYFSPTITKDFIERPGEFVNIDAVENFVGRHMG